MDNLKRGHPFHRLLKVFLSESPMRLAMRAGLKVLFPVRPRSHQLFQWAAEFDALPYIAYAVGLQVAADYALHLGQSGFTAIEFGVAGGNGLVAMSRYASLVSEISGLTIQVVGFDTGNGLPERSDVRDVPWNWNAGDFPCDIDTLRRRIPIDTRLIIGGLEDTFPRWVEESHCPIGFISVDVDYYSSTKAICSTLANAPTSTLLPAVECYFDDCLRFLIPRSVGEAAAISEFNSASTTRMFDRDDWLSEDRPFGERLWLRRMYTLYCFDHPLMKREVARSSQRLDLVAS